MPPAFTCDSARLLLAQSLSVLCIGLRHADDLRDCDRIQLAHGLEDISDV